MYPLSVHERFGFLPWRCRMVNRNYHLIYPLYCNIMMMLGSTEKINAGNRKGNTGMERWDRERFFDELEEVLSELEIQLPGMEKTQEDQLGEVIGKLDQKFKFLQEAAEELDTYAAELLRGNLSVELPSQENFLCEMVKMLHKNLKHLLWQAMQVAGGDCTQHLSYPEGVSTVFDVILHQIKQKEDRLKDEAETISRQADSIQSYNDLLTELTKMRKEWIMVVDEETQAILYCNRRSGTGQVEDGSCEFCQHRLEFQHHLLNWRAGKNDQVWEENDENNQYFLVISFSLQWKERTVNAHIVTNITEEKNRTSQLTSKAYMDSGTGIFNRLYFEEQVDQILEKRKEFIFGYLDLDGLKYVNDKFGHLEGDQYIQSFVSLIKSKIRSSDIFARIGGDEFAVIFSGCPEHVARDKLQKMLTAFIGENEKPYPRSFSYGLVAVNGKEQMTRAEMIKQADAAMYCCKQENKRMYHQRADGWKDSRLENYS